MKKPKLFKKVSPKLFVVFALAVSLVGIGGYHYYRSMPKKIEHNGIEYSHATFKSSKVKNLFNQVQKNPKNYQNLLKESSPLEPEELNQGYQAAVKTFQYDLAIEFYQQGAKDCYQEGEDILLVAINSGRLDLVRDLLAGDYQIKLYHLNAARSLVNIDQANWSYIYQKQATDDLGYQKYLIESQKLASQIIALYKEQNPIEMMQYDTHPNYQDHFNMLYGEKSKESFKELLDQTLSGNYKIETAIHGTQHTPVLVNEEGQSIGIIKTKNELLAQALDHEHFAGVPPAERVFIPKLGDVVVQKWVPNSIMATEFKNEKEWNSEQLHHIRVLDIRLGNSDRNKSNVLITEREGKKIIIPIDHDLIHHYIPNDTHWEAAYLNAPFSPLCKTYIQKLDLEKDASMMKELHFTDEEIKTMKIRTTLLKMAVERNLTLKETDMLYRFYYYDFLEKSEHITANSSEASIRQHLMPHMEKISVVVQNPVEVWGLIGNNFELYL